MKVSATELADNSKAVVERQGPRATQVLRKVGVSKREFLERLRFVRFSEAEQRELKQAMDESAKVFGHAGRD